MNAYELADAIEDWDSDGQWDTPAANMLRQQADRIAELEKQSEPVAWRYRWKNSKGQFSTAWQVCIEEPITDDERFYLEPLYTTPQTKPLSDEEIDQAWKSVDHTIEYGQYRIAVARAIEAKVRGEK